MTRKELLKAAENAVSGTREYDYGEEENTFDIIARLWSCYLSSKRVPSSIFADDVCNMMILLKMARVIKEYSIDDSYADIAGYAACAAEIVDEERNA